MPLQATSGAASYDAFGGGVPVVPNYIEDVFSTWLYTGNGSTQTITNGIDLSGEGGLVWGKSRTAADDHKWYDTNRGVGKYLMSSATNAQITDATSLTAFNADGFSLGSSNANNFNGRVYASWTFRKQPKFFDVQTFTTDSSSNATFSHSLGSSPGCVIFKKTGGAENWFVWHRSLSGTNYYLGLNTTAAQASTASSWISVSSSSISVMGAHLSASSAYVAYIFAHDAGGFGLTGTDNVISCGSYTGNGSTSGPTVTLGYEPQWLLIKRTDTTSNWSLLDTMRGLTAKGADDYVLFPNTTGAETYYSDGFAVLPTGFQLTATNTPINASGGTYIYIAIRRGPMKVPTDATKVFSPIARTGTGTATTTTAGFPVDLVIDADRSKTSVSSTIVGDRMRGGGRMIYSDANSAEVDVSASNYWNFDSSTGLRVGAADNPYFNNTGVNYINWNFRRAPSFFDVVCYTGTGSATTISHNLGVAPELMIVKSRSLVKKWPIYSAATGPDYVGVLNTTADFTNPGANEYWDTAPTASVFTVKTNGDVNTSAATYVAYLFATCPGVSKVGSYTGTATTLQINCGFTGGARFVLIKRTDSTGSWYVWDVARGISSGNDPYLLLNSTAAEVTNTDYIDAYSAGFEISSTAPAEINASGGSFIFLAIS